MSGSPPLIVGLGEALYDLLPAGPALGGAPLNAAVQSHQLGNNAVVASRIGDDALGQTLLDDLAGRGMDTSFIQRDPDAPTGTVEITLRDGEPEYEIIGD
ncbi:MAG: carbohydrate kinase, partial [Verrucomicrobia bacterium]|nr:carbohydrate kinase [Verrucomicrobiota bacterium]